SRILLREHNGGEPAIFLLAVTGGAAGTAIPLAPGTRALSRPLVALEETELRGWGLTTRVMQRRGLRVFGDMAPIRKFALGLTIAHRLHGVAVVSGRAVTTAYLRPRAALSSVWVVP